MASKADKEHLIRLQGMEYALDIAKEKGIEALEKEIRKRSKCYVPLSISQDELNEFCDKVKVNTFKNALILMMVTMRDEFGYGEDRLTRMMERFWKKADCLNEDYTTWDDQTQILAEEVGIDLEVSNEDLTVKIKRG